FCKLMNRAHASDKSVVTNLYMPGKPNPVYQNHVVTNDTVMRDVRSCHHQTILTDFSIAKCICSFIYSYTLTDDSIITNESQGFFSFVFQILWFGRNNGSGINFTIFSDS